MTYNYYLYYNDLIIFGYFCPPLRYLPSEQELYRLPAVT